MLMQIFSILDTKTGAYGQPFFAFNAAVAQRNVSVAVRDNESLFSKFPEDYQLFHVGTFDDATAQIHSFAPVAVCNLVSLREKVHAS